MNIEGIVKVVYIVFTILLVLGGFDTGKGLKKRIHCIFYIRIRIFILILYFFLGGLLIYFTSHDKFPLTTGQTDLFLILNIVYGTIAILLFFWAKKKPLLSSLSALLLFIIVLLVAAFPDPTAWFQSLGFAKYILGLIGLNLVWTAFAGSKAEKMHNQEAGITSANETISKDPEAMKPLLPKWVWISLGLLFSFMIILILFNKFFVDHISN